MNRQRPDRVSRRQVLVTGAGAALVSACGGPLLPSESRRVRDSEITQAMHRATEFMRASCAIEGGYLWAYTADGARQWGEMEAYPTMIWIQPPGTATVGHLYLDCLHATGDDYYYGAAAEVASGLIAAQQPSGGWNYLHDFAGEASIRRWYETIGRNGWRLEEFHHYYGNATFDDAGTAEAAQFLLRMYLERREERYRPSLDRALDFMLDSQYDNGGWPQRFPFVGDMPELHGHPDYTRHITFNDDVAAENLKFLLMVWQTLTDSRALDAINRSMNALVVTQQPAPQGGWGMQHDAQTLQPMGARSYEPKALTTHTTSANIGTLLDFYEWTGERRFLARIPDALGWLESVRLAPDQVRIPGREFPTFVELGTNRPLYNHRRGSNVVNGEYYHDYDSANPITHYSQWRAVNTEALRERYVSLREADPQALRAQSPLNSQSDFALPSYFSTKSLDVSDLNANRSARSGEPPSAAEIRQILLSLNAEGYWPTLLTATSNPYTGDGPASPVPGDYSQTLVGDATDTSPYITDDPEMGISTSAYIRNMSLLMQAADEDA